MPKELLAKIEAAGINKIVLAFSGGHDEGHLDVSIDNGWNDKGELSLEIHEWAIDAYEYHGAGQGIDYGDNYTYDFVRKTVSHDEWCYQPQSFDNGSISFDDLDDLEK
jgi:hypothetical protein